MLQPEEIQKVTFEQSVFSGYKKEDVDAFLDRIYGEYSRLYKENGELVEKLKVCIAKIEEYREDEKFLKSAIVNAQKLNETALQDIALKKQEAEDAARRQAEDIVSQAKLEAQKITEESNRKIAEYKEKSTREYAQQQLDQANAFSARKKEYELMIQAKQQEFSELQEQVDIFKNSVLTIFDQQIALMNKLPEVEKSVEEVEVIEAEATIEPEAVAPVIEEKIAEEIVNNDAVDEQSLQVEDAPESVMIEEEITEKTPLIAETETEVEEAEVTVAEEIQPSDPANEEIADEPSSEQVEDEFEDAQIDIEELIAVKPSPVEPEAPKLPEMDVLDNAAEEEKEEEFHLFGSSPLVFPTDIPEDDEDVSVVKEKNSRFRKKLKFGVDFDVKKDR